MPAPAGIVRFGGSAQNVAHGIPANQTRMQHSRVAAQQDTVRTCLCFTAVSPLLL
jgi:hypothetical protein